MSIIGQVESLWRYPVKSMRGQELDEAFMGYAGIYGDRLFAFKNAAAPKGFPYLTGREQQEMLRYQPRFRNADKAAKPPNLAEAEAIGPGITSLYAAPSELMADVETPSGEVLAIDDEALIRMLTEGVGGEPTLTLLQSERAMTDCRPVSLFSVQTAQQLGRELGITLDKRRFRANIYLDLSGADGFGEDAFVGRSLRIGQKAVVSVLERDPRCKMITLDPDTGKSSMEILRKVSQAHSGKAGVYGAVLVEGTIRNGDTVELMD
ncbi:MOSC domain-containing protein [Nodosilinea nodulosa]|uniref:MOSC domain-containing protein n=1 Tax=Nodosilinea nodulosa TaxID=416001 RepID=UPI0002EFAD3E|nr:MOSC domain-containing protein [Nodosilinea nodulosa]